MKLTAATLAMITTVLCAVGCQDPDKAQETQAPVTSQAKAPESAVQIIPGLIEGTVIQNLTAGRYQYLELNTATGTVWVAAVAENVVKGSKVSCETQMLMEKFESPILKRTFDKVFFVRILSTPRDERAMPANHPPVPGMNSHSGPAPAPAEADLTLDMAKAEGGVSISELAARKDKLQGTEVLLRAKVMKYNAKILGSNWLRVKDASEKRDLVVTTKAEAAVGDIVLIRGKLERDVDLGHGYKYDIIIRNAEVTVEKTAKP